MNTTDKKRHEKLMFSTYLFIISKEILSFNFQVFSKIKFGICKQQFMTRTMLSAINSKGGKALTYGRLKAD